MGAQAALGRRLATPQLLRSTLGYLADRVAGRLRSAGHGRSHRDGAGAVHRPSIGDPFGHVARGHRLDVDRDRAGHRTRPRSHWPIMPESARSPCSPFRSRTLSVHRPCSSSSHSNRSTTGSVPGPTRRRPLGGRSIGGCHSCPFRSRIGPLRDRDVLRRRSSARSVPGACRAQSPRAWCVRRSTCMTMRSGTDRRVLKCHGPAVTAR